MTNKKMCRKKHGREKLVGVILKYHISEPYTEFDWRKMNNNHPRAGWFYDHIRRYFVRMLKGIKFMVPFLIKFFSTLYAKYVLL